MSEVRRLTFWNCEYTVGKTALWLNGDAYYSYGDLEARIEFWKSIFVASSKKSVLYYCENHPESVAVLTAILSSGHALILADPNLSKASRSRLERAYAPNLIVDGAAERPSVSEHNGRCHKIHKDLCLLLSTSGSTGSPKYVRLSKNNIFSNAKAIGEVLDIGAADVAAGHLDMHYSYGLSVVTSHIMKGAGISFSTGKFTDREFWRSVRKAEVTHFPGVPQHYQMMSRLRFERLDIPSVSVMTQAGGALAQSIRDQAFEFMQLRQGEFHVMYGQTEAAPRMSTLQHRDYEAKKDTVGVALPGGSFRILDENSKAVQPGITGTVSYEGPNVMMGYALGWEDLGNGDVQYGRLETGDIGMIDRDGFLTIAGRISRVGKVFGLRVNLDEVEAEISKFGNISVTQIGEHIGIFCEDKQTDDYSIVENTLSKYLTRQYQLPVSAFRYFHIPQLPLTSRHKTDYETLKKQYQD